MRTHRHSCEATEMNDKHCDSCTCGKRAPVQANKQYQRSAGTISWQEHIEAFACYSARYGNDQSAERIAERGGFCYGELVLFLGRNPETWRPR